MWSLGAAGACINGTCACADGWGGDDCSLGPCPQGCSGHGSCTPNGCRCDDGFVPTAAHFVLIEDATDDVSGSSPGVDIDAIGVQKLNGGMWWATSTDDFNIVNSGNTNEFINTSELLGAPDAECQIRNFTALGGAKGNGRVTVSFASTNFSGDIENGDRIRVVELGQTECGQYQDEPYVVSVSSDMDLFIEIGRASGSSDIVVSGL